MSLRAGSRLRLRPAALLPPLVLLAGLTGEQAHAARNRVADPAAVCLQAAADAGRRHGVPAEVMRAITRTETGRARGGALEPWPWTVNMEGAGRWFDSPAETLAYVRAEQARGARSFDLGCFQVNHRWHGEHFTSLEAMLDPYANGDYAARFLSLLHEETGDWVAAAGLYHSRTPEFRDRYAARFERILSADGGAADETRALRAGRRRAPALIARVADALPPAAAGAIAISVLRGGLSPLRGAAGPLID